MRLITIIALFCIAALSWADEITIIAHPSVADESLSKREIQDIFLGRRTNWSDGTRIVLVIHKDGDIHDAFLREYVGRNASQFTAHWRQQVFTGRGRAPNTVNDSAAALKEVAATRGAIGYASPADDTVKALTVSD